MNRFARLLALRVSGVVLCFHAVAAPGCSYRFYWQGPSNWFNVLDVNEDGSINRLEAEFSDPRTMLPFQFPFILDSMSEDCDKNGAITWKEYHGNRWGGEHCDWMEDSLTAVLGEIDGLPGYHTALTPRLVDDPGRYAPLAADGTYEVLALSRSANLAHSDYEERMAARVANRTESSDADIDPSAVTFSCDELTEDTMGITNHWLSDVDEREGIGPLQRCELRNDTQQRAVAAIIVRVTAGVSGTDLTTLHQKAVVVEPGSVDSTYLLHQRGTSAADIELIAVKYFSK